MKKVAFYNSKGGTGVTSKTIEFANSLKKQNVDSMIVFKEHDDFFPSSTLGNSISYSKYKENENQHDDKVIVFDLSGLFRGKNEASQNILKDCDYVVRVDNGYAKELNEVDYQTICELDLLDVDSREALELLT
jgi:cellulose biosynthesis protein BcsQ